MTPDDANTPPKPKKESSGFLIRKCFEEQGFMIGPDIEVRIFRILGSKVVLAVKAPRDVEITLAE